MSGTVKAKVSESHFKKQVNVGDKKLVKDEAREVQVNSTVRNMERAGNVVIVEGSLRSDDEKSFRGDDGTGEESEKDDLSEKTVSELRDLCEQHDLKKSGTKDEIIERLKNSE